MPEDGETETTERASAELVGLLTNALGPADRLGHAFAAIHIKNASDLITSAADLKSEP